MKEIIKYIKPYWKTVVLIILFLALEAYCDLALPQYTSEIIDTGIQNRGIEHILPAKITEKEFKEAELFMNEDEEKLWEESYDKSNSIYSLKVEDEEKLDGLDEELMIPIALTHQLGHMKEENFNKMTDGQSFINTDELDTFKMKDEKGKEHTYVDTLPYFEMLKSSGIMGDEAVEKIRSEMEKTIETTGNSTIKSMGISYAAFCSENAGVDVNKLQKNFLWTSGSRMFIVAFIMLAAAVMVSFLAARTGAAVGRDLRSGVFKKVMSFSNGEMDTFQTSSLITRNTNDIQQIQNVIAVVMRMVMYAPIIGIGGIYKVAKSGSGMGWIVCLALIFIIGFVMLLISLTMPKFRMMQDIIDNLNRVSREILTGLPVIRAFKREDTEEKRFEKTNTELKKVQLFTNRVMTMMMPGMLLTMNCLVILITWVSAKRIDSGVLQVGVMTAFITYSMLIVMAFLMMTMTSVMLPRAGVAAKRIEEVLNTEVSIKDKEDAVAPESCKGIIEFKNVNFRYPNAKENVLNNISFKAEPGKTTAIIGSTGSGKSTLINLIPRFYDVSEGEITLDGKDIRELPLKYLRDKIGLVPQKGILFSGTIESNLRYGAEDCDMKDIQEAAQIAQAEDFILSKNDKYESPIAQGGNNVSGGQKQRIAIGRAIAKKPEILIFDDSFSALDMKTDAKLRHELSQKISGVTEIIVAQRISSILNADQILVIDDGEIVGTGTHKELMKSCEVYRQIAMSQLSEKELGGDL